MSQSARSIVLIVSHLQTVINERYSMFIIIKYIYLLTAILLIYCRKSSEIFDEFETAWYFFRRTICTVHITCKCWFFPRCSARHPVPCHTRSTRYAWLIRPPTPIATGSLSSTPRSSGTKPYRARGRRSSNIWARLLPLQLTRRAQRSVRRRARMFQSMFTRMA